MNHFLLRIYRCQLYRWMTPKVRGLAFGGVLALVVLLGNYEVLQAAPVTFRFELEVTEIDDSNFLRGEYDFGTRFASIESVAIEFLMPSGLSGGFCSGGGCSFSSLFIELHNIEHIVDRPENSTFFLAPEGTELTLISPTSPLSQPEQLASASSTLDIRVGE